VDRLLEQEDREDHLEVDPPVEDPLEEEEDHPVHPLPLSVFLPTRHRLEVFPVIAASSLLHPTI
jgi:hypothetical protein